MKFLAASVAAMLLAAGGAAYWWSAQDGGAPSRLRQVLRKGPAPTAAFWEARQQALLESGLLDPYGIAVDTGGNVYFSDGGDSNQLRRLAPDGSVTVLAGGGEGFVDGPGAQARFNTPSGIARDAHGNLYIADTGNHAIRKLAPDGSVSTLAGNGMAGDADGVGAAAQFNGPVGIALAPDGALYIADTYNDRIRRLAPDGTVTTVAGGKLPGLADGVGGAALFDTPCGIAVGKDGQVYVADSRNDAIRAIAPDGTVTTLALAPEDEREPLLRRPMALALSHDGHLYIGVNGRGRILQRTPDGRLAGLPDVDHPANAETGVDGLVRLFGPRGLALAADGSLLASDGPAQALLRIAPPGKAAAAGGVLRQAQAAVPPSPATVEPGLKERRRAGPMPWPVLPQFQPHEVVGLMGEVRGAFGGDSRHHFHAGLDVQAPVGAGVHVVEAAKVSDPLANWGYGNIAEGISLGTTSYIHMKVGRDQRNRPLDARFTLLRDAQGKPERIRVPRGTRFAVGDQLGVVNQMAHVHLDMFERGRVVNPLAMPFPGLRDTVAPRIQGIAVYDGRHKRQTAPRGKPLRLDRALGEVEVVVDAFDQMDDNLARRRLGIYRLGYQILDGSGQPLPGFAQPRITQIYDQLPRQREAVRVVYAEGSGITAYGSKATRFTYSLHSLLKDGEVAPGKWRIAELAPGDYILRVYAADFAGNTAWQGRDLALTLY